MYIYIYTERERDGFLKIEAEVLITSATDALAFLVGATTVLPALGWPPGRE